MATITNPGVPVPLSNGLTYHVRALSIGGYEALEEWAKEHFQDPSINLMQGVGSDKLGTASGLIQVVHQSTGESLDDVRNLSPADIGVLFAKWHEVQQADAGSKKKGQVARNKTPNRTTGPKS